MSPRPYRLGRRQPAAQRTRARVLRAARELLTARAGAEPFSVDAVARRAGVARMTVYHQFGSRRGSLAAAVRAARARRARAGGGTPLHADELRDVRQPRRPEAQASGGCGRGPVPRPRGRRVVARLLRNCGRHIPSSPETPIFDTTE